jgi:hypothetical protein
MRFASAKNAASLASPLKHWGTVELYALEDAMEIATGPM